MLYEDKIVVTYFIDMPEHIKFTKENVVSTEKAIERAEKSAFSSTKGSYKFEFSAPERKVAFAVFFRLNPPSAG